jgi:hypothetical protein
MLFFAVVPAFSAWTPPAVDYGAKGIAVQKNCEVLKDYVLTLNDETFKKPVTNVTATWKTDSSGATFCQVVGWIWPETKFEVTMPTLWNERYYMRGGGGWHGALNLPTTANAPPSGNGGNAPIGYAESQSNGGFTGANWPVDKATPGAQAGQGTFGLKEPYFSEYYNTDPNPTNWFPKPTTEYYGDIASYAGKGNPNACQMIVDWGYRFLYETPVIAKKIIKKYYGISPKKTYYWGTSCGGKEGQIAAQKFPELYDGYFIGYPLGGHLAVTFRGTWDTYWGADLVKQADPSCVPKSCPNPPGSCVPVTCPNVYSFKAALHYKTVYDKCDGIDGLVDGMIDDPTKCKFDAMTELPACKAAEEAAEGVNNVYSSTCFTTAQRKAIAEIYAGPHDSRGKPWYPGQTLSAEYVVKSGTGLSAALADAMGVPMFPNIALDPPDGPYFDITKIDWNRMPREMQRTTCEQCYENGRCETFNIHDTIDGITISPSPTFNMGGFRTVYKKGAKIVQTHGWSDSLVTPLAASKELYENTLKTVGVDRTKSFWKLYLVPGAGHGGGGLSTWLLNWDAFNAMVEWVERGVEPGAINGSRAAGVDLTIDPVTNKLKYPDIRTRPNCPYPEVARWDGTGSIDKAESFTCVPPIDLKVEPDALNLNRHGLLTAFITLPEGYHMKDWNLKDVMLAGAKAKSGLAVGNKYIATFRTQDLQNVTPGKSVELTVTGSFNRNAKKSLVQATDTVRVFEHHAQH